MRSSLRSWLGLWQRFGFRALRDRWNKRLKRRRKARDRDTLGWTRHRCGFEGLEARRMLAAFSVSDPTFTEGGTAQFVVSYTGSLTGMAMVSYATANNTATTSDTDYTSASGGLMFMQGGATSQTVNVSTTNDSKDEDDETFYLNLSNPSNATIADSQGVATIQDNDSAPTLSINDPSASESTSATHTVTLSAASGKTITVDYATADNSSAVAGTDYTAASGTLTFNPGETSKQFTVAHTSDSIDEYDESYVVNLSNASNATISDSQGTASIVDTTPAPTVNIASSASATEGSDLSFAVTLSAASGKTVTVDYATAAAGGTPATAGTDYTAASGTLTFNPGETTKYVSIVTTDDALDEPAETLQATISNPGNATLGGTTTGIGTINDNDDPPAISIADASATEAGTIQLTVTLSAASGKTVTVDWVPSEGTAVSADFTIAGGTVTFNPGETSKTVNVVTTGDSYQESDESVIVTLSNAGNATIADATGIGTILDDDTVGQINLNDAVITRGIGVNGQTGANVLAVGLTAQAGLFYDSSTDPRPIVVIETEHPEDAPTPDKIKAELTFGGIVATPIWYSGLGLDGGDTIRIALQVDAASLATGRYNWTVKLTEYYGSQTSTRTFGGQGEIVNRNSGPFGRGWWLAGLDQLIITTPAVTLVGDEGAISYTSDGEGGYNTPAGRFDTLVKNGDDTFTLTGRYGDVRQFDTAGKLTARVDRNGNETVYAYDGGLLSTITDPFGRETVLTYTDGKLTGVNDHADRDTTLAYTSGRLISVTRPDPDGGGAQSAPVTAFGYDGTTQSLTTRTDALSRVTTYSYNFARRLSETEYDDETTTQISAIQLVGLVNPAGGTGTQTTPALLVGPGAAVGAWTNGLSQTSDFTTDRFGNFTSYTDALSNTTTWERDENGQVLVMTQPDPDGGGPQSAPVTEYEYDERGNLLLITFADATTNEFAYDEDFNQLVGFTDELGRVTLYTIDEANGNVTEVRQVVGEVDDEINEETDDVVTAFTYTAAPEDPGDLPAGLLVSVTDPLGRLTVYAYQESAGADFGRLISITYADGTADETTEQWEYDAAGNVTAKIDGLGRRTEMEYDALDRLIGVTLPDPDGAGELESPELAFAYDAVGNLVTQTDALGRITIHEYDAHNRRIKTTQPDPDGAGGQTAPETEWEYDAAGQLIGQIDALGNETNWDYDNAGRLIEQALPDPDGYGGQSRPEVATTYDALGRAITQTDALGNVTSFEYDSRGRLVEVTGADPDGGGGLAAPVTVYTYDDAGQLETVTDPLGRVTSYAYNELGQLVEVTQPDPDGEGGQAAPVSTFEYDKAGNLRFTTDALGNVTEYQYDALNRLVKTIAPDPDGEGGAAAPETENAYDDAGQLVSVTDALGRVTLYVYDGLGRLIEVTLPDPDGGGALASPVWAYTYDAAGNKLTETDPLGNTTSFEYDNLDRLIEVTQADPDGAGGLTAPVSTYAYNAVGQVVTAVDPLGRTTSYAFDGLGRLIEMTLPDPDGGGGQSAPVYEYTYDAAGNTLTEIDPLGHVTSYQYDDLHRLVKITGADPDGGGGLSAPETTFVYDAAGQQTSVTDPLGRTVTYAYDGLGRVVSITQPDPDGGGGQTAPVSTFTYDAVGNTLTETDPLGKTTSYDFDNLYRLLSVTQPDPDGAGGLSAPVTVFAYDAVGNRTSLTDPVGNVTVWTYDNLDRVIEEENELNDSRYFVYDAANNLVEKTDRNERVTEYEFDDLHRVIEERWLDDEESVIYTFAYAWNSASQMLSAVDDVSSIEFTYDNLGRATAIEIDNGGPVVILAQAFDAAGNRTSLAAEIDSTDDFLNAFTYDNLNRMTRITQAGQGGNTVAEKRVDFAYNAAGQFTAIDRYKDTDGGSTHLVVETAYTYDLIGRLTDLVHTYVSVGRLNPATHRQVRTSRGMMLNNR